MKTALTSLPQPQLFESLLEAKERLRLGLDKGTICPCCNQYAKIYNRKLNSIMAYALLRIERYFRNPDADEWLHIRRFLLNIRVMSNDYDKLENWGLMVHKPSSEVEQYSGLWRITTLGIEFVHNRVTVPEKIQFLNGIATGQSDSRTNIIQSLGAKFNYYDLMSAEL